MSILCRRLDLDEQITGFRVPATILDLHRFHMPLHIFLWSTSTPAFYQKLRQITSGLLASQHTLWHMRNLLEKRSSYSHSSTALLNYRPVPGSFSHNARAFFYDCDFFGGPLPQASSLMVQVDLYVPTLPNTAVAPSLWLPERLSLLSCCLCLPWLPRRRANLVGAFCSR